MLKSNLCRSVISASLSWSLIFTSAASASSGVTNVTGGTISNFDSGNRTLGYTFTPQNNVIIDTLGLWDNQGDGLDASHIVGIWNSAGALKANVTIAAGTANSASGPIIQGGQVRSAPTFIFLTAGQTYTISALYNNDDEFISAADGFTMSPDFTYIDERLSAGNSGFSFPTLTSSRLGILGPSFTYVNAAPEPTSLTLIATTPLLTRRRRY